MNFQNKQTTSDTKSDKQPVVRGVPFLHWVRGDMQICTITCSPAAQEIV
jgi:hypothetical protein